MLPLALQFFPTKLQIPLTIFLLFCSPLTMAVYNSTNSALPPTPTSNNATVPPPVVSVPTPPTKLELIVNVLGSYGVSLAGIATICNVNWLGLTTLVIFKQIT